MHHRDGVLALFGSQYWVATVRQLGELGVSRQAASDAVRRGLADRVFRGVLGIPGHWDTFEGRCSALQLAVTTGRRHHFLSGTTSARLYGLRSMSEVPVTLTLDESHPIVVPDWARIVRTSWDDDEPRPARTDHLRLASPHRTLFDLAGQLRDGAFERAAEDAWHLGLVTPESAAEYLQRIRRRGRSGVARFERWLERTEGRTAPAASRLELLLIDLARRAGLPEPVRQHPLRLPDGTKIHLDIAWPDLRFALEPGHSWWHGGDLAQRADQARDRGCAELGWQVVRYDESVWGRRATTVREIAAMYRARQQVVARQPTHLDSASSWS